MPDLQVPLQSLSELVPGCLLPFSRSASAPAIMLVEDVRLCLATPVRVGAHRAARVLSIDAPLPTTGEL
jgi:flagellar motor switch protein FliM